MDFIDGQQINNEIYSPQALLAGVIHARPSPDSRVATNKIELFEDAFSMAFVEYPFWIRVAI